MKLLNQFDYREFKRRQNATVKTYAKYAVIYDEMRAQLLDRLSLIKINPKQVLILGDAIGQLSQAISEKYPEVFVVGVDCAVERLKQQGKNKVACWAEQLAFSDQSFDLVVSNAMLPWCADLAIVFNEIRRVLQTEGLFLFTTFGPDTLKEWRQYWAEVDDSPHVQQFLDMHDVGDALVQSGFVDPVMDANTVQIHYQSWWQSWQDLKFTGSTNVLKSRKKTLCPAKVARGGIALLCPSERATITYEIIHGHAWCPAVQRNKRNYEFPVKWF